MKKKNHAFPSSVVCATTPFCPLVAIIVIVRINTHTHTHQMLQTLLSSEWCNNIFSRIQAKSNNVIPQ